MCRCMQCVGCEARGARAGGANAHCQAKRRHSPIKGTLVVMLVVVVVAVVVVMVIVMVMIMVILMVMVVVWWR